MGAGELLETAAIESNTGVRYDKAGDHKEAIAHYLRALELFEQYKRQNPNILVHTALDKKITPLRNRCEKLQIDIKKDEVKVAPPVIKEAPKLASSTETETASTEDAKVPICWREAKAPPFESSVDGYKNYLRLMFDKDVGSVTLDDVIGQEEAKRAVTEAIIYPMMLEGMMPTNLAWYAVLFYGPPGTGKTMLARAVASSYDAAFIAVSAAEMFSSYHGESEKQIKALFEVARERAPCVLFFDEVDSICSRRNERESDATRHSKTEFLIQMGALEALPPEKRVIVLAATNVPWDLDTAALRRFQKRIYVGLPDFAARNALFRKLLQQKYSMLSDMDLEELAKRSEGMSADDISLICRDAVMKQYSKICEAKHFKPVTIDGERKYMPLPNSTGCGWSNCDCNTAEIEPTALPLSCPSFAKNELAVPLLQWSDVFASLSAAKRTVSEAELERYALWNSS